MVDGCSSPWPQKGQALAPCELDIESSMKVSRSRRASGSARSARHFDPRGREGSGDLSAIKCKMHLGGMDSSAIGMYIVVSHEPSIASMAGSTHRTMPDGVDCSTAVKVRIVGSGCPDPPSTSLGEAARGSAADGVPSNLLSFTSVWSSAALRSMAITSSPLSSPTRNPASQRRLHCFSFDTRMSPYTRLTLRRSLCQLPIVDGGGGGEMLESAAVITSLLHRTMVSRSASGPCRPRPVHLTTASIACAALVNSLAAVSGFSPAAFCFSLAR